jgi:uncharacterized membrane protein
MVIANHIHELKILAALGCGLVGGIFFAFSTFVMNALGRLQPPQGITAMQSINITVINPWFMTVFLGTAALCVVLAIFAVLRWHQPYASYLLIGSLLYLMGTFLVTILCNVPLNDALASVNPNSTEAATLWTKYLVSWTLWNHVRAVAAITAATVFMLTLSYRAAQSWRM